MEMTDAARDLGGRLASSRRDKAHAAKNAQPVGEKSSIEGGRLCRFTSNHRDQSATPPRRKGGVVVLGPNEVRSQNADTVAPRRSSRKLELRHVHSQQSQDEEEDQGPQEQRDQARAQKIPLAIEAGGARSSHAVVGFACMHGRL